jgi:hypothetical protein
MISISSTPTRQRGDMPHHKKGGMLRPRHRHSRVGGAGHVTYGEGILQGRRQRGRVDQVATRLETQYKGNLSSCERGTESLICKPNQL